MKFDTTAPLLTLQFLMHDRYTELRDISTKGILSNHQMHAVKSSFNDGTALPIVATNIKPEIHTAFRWISANTSDLQCIINTQRGQVCLSQNQNFVST
jgi:Na+/H+ antiporter NhaB